MNNTAYSIIVSRLNVSRGGTAILRDINCSIKGDGVSVIIGPNGAGKSIFLHSLHGLIAPDSGSIVINSNNPNRQAMVFQTPVLLRRSVISNLRFVANCSKKATLNRLGMLLDRVGLSDHHNRAARSLSGGEQQRLALARALVNRPQILFLDEPTANLDPATVKIFEDIIESENKMGTKIIMVTHDLAQAQRIAQEILFFHKGQLLAQDFVEPFFHRQKNTLVTKFLHGELIF